MKKLHIAMAIAASISASALVQAEDYQIEGGFTYSDAENDAGDSDTGMGLDGTYYIETVSTSGTVLNEAAFVGRNNNLNATYTTWDERDFDVTDIGVEWWFEDIYAAANMNSNDDFDTNTIQVGYMVQENTLVAFVMETGDQEDDGMGVRAKYVGELGGNTINLEASYIDATDGAMSIGGDFYFSETLSAGVMMNDSGADDAESEMVLSVKNFFTPTVSGELDFTTDAGGDEGTDIMALRVAKRF